MSRNKTETFLSVHFIEDQKNVLVMMTIVILITSITYHHLRVSRFAKNVVSRNTKGTLGDQ